MAVVAFAEKSAGFPHVSRNNPRMIATRFFHFLSVITVGLSVTSPLPARAENPLEALHKKIFGDDDKKKDKDKKKKKHHDDDHHGDDHRSDDHRYYQQAAVVERRVYVEPAPRPYYEQRREIYVEPAPREYAPRPIEADVQLALRRQGYYRGPVDGDLGPETRAAIRDYQYDRRLPATGRIDTSLLRSLGL